MLKDCDSSSIALFLFPSHVCVAYQTRHAVGVVGGALTMPGFFYVTVQFRDWLKKAHWSLVKNCGILAVVMTIGRRALERNDFQHYLVFPSSPNSISRPPHRNGLSNSMPFTYFQLRCLLAVFLQTVLRRCKLFGSKLLSVIIISRKL